MRARRPLTALLAIVGSTVALAHPAPAAATGPGLSGEVFGVPDFLTISDTHCDPAGVSSFRFTVRGIALGPYPGVYYETGRVVIAPQMSPPFDRFRNFASGALLELDANFRVESAAGEVTGEKHLVTFFLNVGACAEDAEHVFAPGGIPELCTNADFYGIDGSLLEYRATITTAGESFEDAGASTLFLLSERAECPSVLPGVHGGDAFQETFFTLSPVNTPGHATGGGRLSAGPGGGYVAFGFNARSDGDRLEGNCTLLDDDTRTLVKCLTVTSFVQVGNTVVIRGLAEVDGVVTSYRIEATDNGEAGTGLDVFALETDSGYSAAGPVEDGNVAVHRE